MSTENSKTILIADDHPLLLIGLRGIFEHMQGYSLVAEATNGNQAVEMFKLHQPTISIIDLEIPGINGIDILRAIKSEGKSNKVVILTSHKEQSFLNQAIDAGADGYLLKDFANNEISICLNELEKGNTYYSEQLSSFISSEANPDPRIEKLSRTEKKVIRLIGQEKSSKEIGEILFISPKTVDNHRSSIIRKLELVNKKNSLFSWASKHLKHL